MIRTPRTSNDSGHKESPTPSVSGRDEDLAAGALDLASGNSSYPRRASLVAPRCDRLPPASHAGFRPPSPALPAGPDYFDLSG